MGISLILSAELLGSTTYPVVERQVSTLVLSFQSHCEWEMFYEGAKLREIFAYQYGCYNKTEIRRLDIVNTFLVILCLGHIPLECTWSQVVSISAAAYLEPIKAIRVPGWMAPVELLMIRFIRWPEPPTLVYTQRSLHTKVAPCSVGDHLL